LQDPAAQWGGCGDEVGECEGGQYQEGLQHFGEEAEADGGAGEQ
jgi:hypothetical protein